MGAIVVTKADIPSNVAAIVVPCSARKTIRPSDAQMAITVPPGRQNEVVDAWVAIIEDAAAVTPASSLYCGRNIHLARAASSSSKAPLWIISAGLGLVASDTDIPAYGLTVSGGGEESIRRRIAGRFDAEAWWSRIAGGPFSQAFANLLDRPGHILVALTQPYARMVAGDLAATFAGQIDRLRLFGAGLSAELPANLHAAIMPYDERLDAILPGTRSDFAVRGLAHFVSQIPVSASSGADHAAVVGMMAGAQAPVRFKRPRLSDDRIVERIREHLQTTRGIGKVLRRLRDEDEIACEQGRFTRLYKIASMEGVPA